MGFAAWIPAYVMLARKISYLPFMLMYPLLILLTCGYCIKAEIDYAFKARSSAGVGYLLCAGAVGFVGLVMPFVSSDALCRINGHLTGDFVWFLGSDVSMWLIYLWFVNRKVLSDS